MTGTCDKHSTPTARGGSASVRAERYHYHPIEELNATRAHIVYQYLNSWWIVMPGKGLAFFDKGYGHPQCNRNKEIAERLRPPGTEVQFFERVIAPCNVNDYRD